MSALSIVLIVWLGFVSTLLVAILLRVSDADKKLAVLAGRVGDVEDSCEGVDLPGYDAGVSGSESSYMARAYIQVPIRKVVKHLAREARLTVDPPRPATGFLIRREVKP